MVLEAMIMKATSSWAARMRVIRDDRFPDGKLVANLAVDRTDVRLVRQDDAHIELRFALDCRRELVVKLFTAKIGRIKTWTEPVLIKPVPGLLAVAYRPDGSLQSVTGAGYCGHLEHMDRGHYSLGLSPEHDATLHINFVTRGYIKTAVSEESLKDSDAAAA